jgi:rhodanese-related sulfurtransferase
MTDTEPFFTDLDVPDYHARREAGFDHTLVDVREDWEYALGHIPGALHIPLDELAARAAEIPSDKPVVVVCEHGIRSLMAAEYLADSGFAEVYSLLGGTSAWRMHRLPLHG